MTRTKTTQNNRGTLDVERIATAALDLFNENGYDGTSMDQIARQLGVTKAALYYHAPGGKTQLLDHAMRRVMDPLWGSLQETGAVNGNNYDRLQYALTRQVELVLQGIPEITKFLISIAHHPPKDQARARRRADNDAIRQMLEDAKADGDMRQDVEPAITLRLMLGMVYSVNEWYRSDGAKSQTDIRDTVLALIFQGINP